METHKLESYNIDFIKSLIDNEIEESIHIEFKRADSLSKKDSAKKEISKDVSAFANSDGGILIYGIEENNHKASNFSFVDGSVFTKEWLEQVISSTIFRTIKDLIIFPVRFNSKLEQTIYVVQIPSSLDAPHLTKEKRFYRRHNFESVLMEEYEIRQLYGRKLKSKLAIANYKYTTSKDDENDNIITCSFKVSVVNIGEVLEKRFKVNVYFDNMIDGMYLSWPQLGISRDYFYTEMSDGTGKVTSICKDIYPNEQVTAISFNFNIPKDNFKETSNNLKIRIALLYPNGNDSIELNFSDLEFNITETET